MSLYCLPQMLKKIKNRCKQNFEDDANNMQLDKEDIERFIKRNYCVFNILILIFVLIVFNKLTCIVRLHILVQGLSKCSKGLFI